MLSFQLPTLQPNEYIKLSIRDGNAFADRMMRYISCDKQEQDSNTIADPQQIDACFDALSIEWRTYQPLSLQFVASHGDGDEYDATEDGTRRQAKKRKLESSSSSAAENLAQECLTQIPSANLLKEVQPVMHFMLFQCGNEASQHKGVKPWSDISLASLPYHVALYILEFKAIDLFGSENIAFRDLLGRFRADSSRKLHLVFRSLRLRAHKPDSQTLNYGDLWKFIMRSAKQLIVYLADNEVPLGFEWMLRCASAETMPQLRSISVQDASIHSNGDTLVSSTYKIWTMNDFLNSRVTEIGLRQCKELSALVSKGKFPNLQRLDIFDTPGEMQRNGTYKSHFNVQAFSQLPRLKELFVGIRCYEDVKQIAETVQNSASIMDIQFSARHSSTMVEDLQIEWFSWVASMPRLQRLMLQSIDTKYLPKVIPATSNLKELHIFDFVVDSLEGLENATQLQYLSVCLSSFEHAGLELLLGLPSLSQLVVLDGGYQGYSPTLRNVVLQLIGRGQLNNLIMSLMQQERSYKIRDGDLSAIFSNPACCLTSFELQLRNKASFDDSREEDEIPNLEVTSNCLLSMCLCPSTTTVTLDIPGLQIDPVIIEQILHLNLLETILLEEYLRNEEF